MGGEDCVRIRMGANQTVFSAEDIYFLEKHSIMDRAQVEEWYKNFKEVNPTGEVSRETYRKLYSETLFGEIGQTEKMQELVFNALDTNKNGKISFREWLLAVCICRKGTHDEKLAWTFRLYDTDGSGSIDFEEVKRVTRALFSHFSPMTDEETTTRAESFFNQFEKNADGSVSQEHFMKALKNENNLIDLLTL